MERRTTWPRSRAGRHRRAARGSAASWPARSDGLVLEAVARPHLVDPDTVRGSGGAGRRLVHRVGSFMCGPRDRVAGQTRGGSAARSRAAIRTSIRAISSTAARKSSPPSGAALRRARAAAWRSISASRVFGRLVSTFVGRPCAEAASCRPLPGSLVPPAPPPLAPPPVSTRPATRPCRVRLPAWPRADRPDP